MKSQTCCFTGHRDIATSDLERVGERLRAEITHLIKQGYLYFGTGGALGFDTMAAQTVLDLKDDYPDIKLILVLPCIEQTKNWTPKDIAIYEDIKNRCDKHTYTSEHYHRGCMHKRNRHLVDNSSICIAYLSKSGGGTAYTVKYANEQNVRVVNIAK